MRVGYEMLVANEARSIELARECSPHPAPPPLAIIYANVLLFLIIWIKSIYIGLYKTPNKTLSCLVLEQKKAFAYEKSSTPTGLVWDTNMAAVSLFWDANVAAVTSCKNTL